MSSENELEVPKFNRVRRGSVDDTIKDFLNPKLEFHQEQLPKGSNALQILIHQCEDEKNNEDSGSDSDVDEDKMKKPSPQYMGRRRNTISCNYSHSEGLERQFRKMSLAPIPERGRLSHLLPPDSSRARSLSPMQANKLRRNSVHHTEIGFGSTHTRETRLK